MTQQFELLNTKINHEGNILEEENRQKHQVHKGESVEGWGSGFFKL